MDDYSKTGPKKPSAMARDRERDQIVRLKRVLQATSEEIFVAALQTEFEVTKGHPRFDIMLKLYRTQHPSE